MIGKLPGSMCWFLCLFFGWPPWNIPQFYTCSVERSPSFRSNHPHPGMAVTFGSTCLICLSNTYGLEMGNWSRHELEVFQGIVRHVAWTDIMNCKTCCLEHLIPNCLNTFSLELIIQFGIRCSKWICLFLWPVGMSFQEGNQTVAVSISEPMAALARTSWPWWKMVQDLSLRMIGFCEFQHLLDLLARPELNSKCSTNSKRVSSKLKSSNGLWCSTLPRARLQRLDDQTVMPREV